MAVHVMSLMLLFSCAGTKSTPEEPPAPVVEEPVAEEPVVEEPVVEEPAEDPSLVSPHSPWDGVLSGEATTSDSVLATDARVGLHEGYDRLVLEFNKGIPAYEMAFVESVRQAGSGFPVELAGDTTFLITMHRTSGYDMEAGTATVERSVDVSALSVIAEAAVVDDFEGQLRFGVGLKSRAEPTVDVLSDPPRLVIDFPHPE